MYFNQLMEATLTFKRWLGVTLSLFLLLLLAVLFFSFVGRPYISFGEVFFAKDPVMRDLFFNARLPRILLGVCVGAGLSASGVSFQSLLRNPLADPYILGVSGGAALGGVLALALGLPFHWVSLISFLFGFASLIFLYLIARVEGRLPAHTLLLTGVIYNAFAFALILLVNSLVSIGQAHQILYLLMGSLEAHSLSAILWVGLLTGCGLAILLAASRKMNLIALGEEASTQLGLNTDRLRKLLFFASSLMVGASVSLVGLIGFVGLFVPHIARLLFGADHRLLIPASALLGGIFLVMCDFLARTLFSGSTFQTELPVGVVTALIGGPFFIYLVKTRGYL